ncbi:MAG: S1C family serine protease [Acidobacteriota bacterium]|nr:S1C family serine protease [Acidobacteriota bacterium]
MHPTNQHLCADELETNVSWIDRRGFLCSSVASPQTPPATPNRRKTDVLRELSASFEEISQRSGKAVVQILVRSYVAADESENGGEFLTAQNSSGSGIIMSPAGYILTNAHVVKGPHSLKVQLNVRAEAEAHAKGLRVQAPVNRHTGRRGPGNRSGGY